MAFTSVLENKTYDMVSDDVDSSYSVVKHLNAHCYSSDVDTFAISLSGGVDSMVIATIIKKLGFHVICAHINYNNREESTLEADFLRNWTHANKIEFFYKNIEDFKRGDMNRHEYEEVTRDIRFDLYKEMLSTTEATSIILGHHDDDIIENVINNVCKGRNILDLTVMQKESQMFGVDLSRPLIGLRKSDVYDFANSYNVPYFKDTTPDWSLRGIFRRQLFPIIERTYNGAAKNILLVSKQSDEWGEFINSHIISPLMEESVFAETHTIIPFAKYRTYPECFWKHVLTTIFHKYSLGALSLKSLRNLMTHFTKMPPVKVQLTNNVRAEITNDHITLFYN